MKRLIFDINIIKNIDEKMKIILKKDNNNCNKIFEKEKLNIDNNINFVRNIKFDQHINFDKNINFVKIKILIKILTLIKI